MNKYLFNGLHEWKICMAAAVSHLWWGVCKIIANILFGIVSLFIYFGKKVEAFCMRETTAAFIITTILCGILIGWLSTYMNSRLNCKTLEHERDSVSIRLDRVMQSYNDVNTIDTTGINNQ